MNTLAIQQTADFITYELSASGPCDYVELSRWLVEQCAFDATYLDEALDLLFEQNKICYDSEYDTYDMVYE